MANTIKIKRGLSSNINNTTLAQGELAITTDTNELYVGKASGKEKINVQANYIQNDEKAADYIKNRPCYEEVFTLIDDEVSFTKNDDGYHARSALLSNIPDLSKVSENSEFTLLIGTETFNLTYVGPESEGLVFASTRTESTTAGLIVKPDFTGLQLFLRSDKGYSSDFTETVKLSGSTVHKLDSKFVYSDIDLKPYLSGQQYLIYGTVYTRPTIVVLQEGDSPDRVQICLVSEGIVPGPQ